ncbi:GUN4 domain-containing protein [Lyngbya sp. CCY1209]|uniref:GUN4 domain-containing protein n=1 Tax=Lyngbya sp. CCY1209 TaxID=2886103 RepID=UPI002D21595B|nr:GUN4 domain-containing protein [Lyngbya sp. CCY1209]MEB3886690.1 GUN4 domain-containing protein [Lyngbya sp. CCY1209]
MHRSSEGIMKRKKLLHSAAAISLLSLLSTAIALDHWGRLESEADWESKAEPDFLETVELESAVGMDYTELRDLLAAGRWEEADAETRRLISAIGNREESFAIGLIAGLLGVYNFPCEDLRTIDRLWLKYSDRRFGFSVQLDVDRGLGGTDE